MPPSIHVNRKVPPQRLRQAPVVDNFPVLPQIQSYAGILNAINKTYYIYYDQSLLDSQANSLAMRRDGFIHEILRERQLPVVCLPWHIEVDDPDHPEQKAIGDTLGKIVGAVPKMKSMMLVLLEAVFYGKYAVQVQYGMKKVSGNLWNLPIGHLPVNGDKIRYRHDGTPGIALRSGIQDDKSEVAFAFLNAYADSVMPSMLGQALFLDKEILRDRFIIHTFEPFDTDYLYELEGAMSAFGLGLRSRLYWTWNLRTEIFSWVMDALQRIGANGMLYAFYPEGNTSARNSVLQALQQLVKDNFTAFPVKTGENSYKDIIQRIEASPVGYDIMLNIVNYLDGIMRRAMLGQDLSAESKPTGIGNGATSLQADVRRDFIEYDATMLAETLDQDLVNPIKKYNKFLYEGREYYGNDLPFNCRLKFQLTRENVEAAIQAAGQLFGMGVDLDADDLRGKAGLSPPKNSTTAVVNYQLKQAAQQFAQGVPDYNKSAGHLKELVDQVGQKKAQGEMMGPDGERERATRSRFSKAPEMVTALAGRLYLSASGWGLLKVPNDLVRGIFQAMNEAGIALPPSDSKKKDFKLNAHISVLRPEEIEKAGGPGVFSEFGKHFHYQIGAVHSVEPEGWDGMERVYMIDVDSPELEALREKYGLSKLPNKNKFRFHITVAVRPKKWDKRYTRLRSGDIERFAHAGDPDDCGHDPDGDFGHGNTCAEGDNPAADSGYIIDYNKEYEELLDDKRYKAASKEIFGKILSPRKMATLAGADAMDRLANEHIPIDVTSAYKKEKWGTMAAVSMEADGDKISYGRKVYKSTKGDIVIYNDHFYINDDELAKSGSGLKIFASQVDAAIKAGVDRIECQAAGDYRQSQKSGRERMNGYYTWPRFGYDGIISGEWIDRYAHRLEEFGVSKEDIRDGTVHVSSLMKTPEGREFWLKKGMDINVSFDLKEGSLSRRVLSEYLKEKGHDEPDAPNRFRGQSWKRSTMARTTESGNSSSRPNSTSGKTSGSIRSGTASIARSKNADDSRIIIPANVNGIVSRFGLKLESASLPAGNVARVSGKRLLYDKSKFKEVTKSGDYSTSNPWHAVFHEAGIYGFPRTSKVMIWSNYRDIAGKVSRYATTSPDAFIGEVFAGIAAGRTFPPEVLALFDEVCGYQFPS